MINASHDIWAGELAKKMISAYRTQALTYVRVQAGAYSEEIGQIFLSESRFTSAGAVIASDRTERDGISQNHEVEAWIDHEAVPWPVTTSDYLQYLGKKWKITEIVSYGSGGGPSGNQVYITTRDGKNLVTQDGRQIIAKGEGSQEFPYTMYASRVRARAE